MNYFFRLRSNGKEKRVIFFNFRQPPNTLHIHSSDRERTWPEAHCHVCDCRAFSTMGEGFSEKAKKRDDELRALDKVSGNSSGGKRSAQNAGSQASFFPGQKPRTGNTATSVAAAEGDQGTDPTLRRRRPRKTGRRNDGTNHHAAR